MKYLVNALTFMLFMVLVSCNSGSSSEGDQSNAAVEATPQKKEYNFKVPAKDQRKAGDYYLEIQKALSLSEDQRVRLYKIHKKYRNKKKELDQANQWKGDENRGNRRQLQRDENASYKKFLGEELYEMKLAFDKAWEA